MKKALKIYGWAWVIAICATLLTVVIMVIHTSHHELAESPDNIEIILKVDLPDIEFSESRDNLNRSVSRWDIFEHSGKFSDEVSEESLMALDNLCQRDSIHWRKYADKGVYSYSDGGGIDELYYVHCAISKDCFTITYEIDESEGIFVLFKWGVVLMIIALIRRVKRPRLASTSSDQY